MSYIGNEPIVSATRTITESIASAGQTVFNVSGGYTVGFLDVFINGAQLQTSDFTATNGTTVTLSTACAAGDDVRLVAWGSFNVANAAPQADPVFSGKYLKLPVVTTAGRETSPSFGMVAANSTTGDPEWWDPTTSTWKKFAQPSGYSVEYLVVAGGGGGGQNYGGGGGAGGLLASSVTLSSGTTYTITVGAGGVGTPAGATAFATSGSNSSISTIATATGGGGGSTGATGYLNGLSGGSGGGGNINGLGGSGTSGQGFAGGNGGSGVNGGAGGGGAGAVGGNVVSGGVGVSGGSGLTNSISGSAVTYGGGGGGGSNGTTGAGGAGGGGTGGGTGVAGTSGTVNLGAGGGGGGASSAAGGSGGSGVVIIRYLGSQRGTGGTVTSSGGYTIHTFTSSGTYVA